MSNLISALVVIAAFALGLEFGSLSYPAVGGVGAWIVTFATAFVFLWIADQAANSLWGTAMFGIFKRARKEPTMMDALIHSLYGPRPPSKTANLDEACGEVNPDAPAVIRLIEE
jgi:Zn-dependent protease with chaperone function